MKEKIINEFKIKINELKKHNNLYYNNDSPLISDAEYDDLKKELLELETNNPYLKKYASVEKIIGTSPSNKFKKIKHLQPIHNLLWQRKQTGIIVKNSSELSGQKPETSPSKLFMNIKYPIHYTIRRFVGKRQFMSMMKAMIPM